MRRWVGAGALSIVFSLVGAASEARAQGDRAAAEALFQEGRKLAEAGEHEKACAKFDASHQLDETALGTSLHLADCYERIGKTASAWALFEEVASLAQMSGQSQRAEIARVRARDLAPRLSRIHVEVPAEHGVPGLVVEVAGSTVPQASWGSAIPTDPGSRVVVARAPGYVTWTSTVEIPREPGTSQSVRVPLLLEAPRESAPRESAPILSPAPATPPPAPLRQEQPTFGGVRIAGVVIGTVGLAGLAMGAGLGVRAMDVNEDSLDQCRPDDPSLCTADGVELRSEARDFALGSTVSFAIGGALAATGLLMIVVPRADSEEAAALEPIFVPGGGGLVARGSW